MERELMVYRLDEGSSAVFWWESPKGQVHEHLFPHAQRLRDQDATRRARVLRLMRMYGNYPGAMPIGAALDDTRLRDNIIGENVDAVLSEITLQDPKVAFLVTGGDWTLRQAAKAREGMVDATLRDCGWFKGLGRQVMLDAAVTGDGFAVVRPCFKSLRPQVRRLLPLEVLVDEADGRDGHPRRLTIVHPVDRYALAAECPRHAQVLLDRSKTKRWMPSDTGGVEDWLVQDSREHDLVLVAESWLLPSSPEAEDGRHVVVTESLDLLDEDYCRARFPVVHVAWKAAMVGYYGIGLAHDLQADQIELNRTLMKIQDSVGAAAGMWLLQRGSKVNPRKITDIPGSIIEFEGIPPQYTQPNTFPSDLVEHTERVRARARARAGVSEMASTGAKPTGLQSGEAIRSFRDQFSMRQSPHAKAYEAFTVDLGQAIVDCWEDIYDYLKGEEKREGEARLMPEVTVEVRRGRRKVLKRMRWEESGLPENETLIESYPTSSLPNHPASRTETVQEWLGAGLINADEARSLLDFPDTQGHLELALADQDYALFAFETMVEDGEYVPPEPYQRLDMAMELIRRAYLRARIDGCPEERLDLVRDHLAEIKRLIEKQAAEEAAKAQAAQAAAAPTAQPTMMPPDAAMPAPDMAGMTEMAPAEMVA